MRLIEDLSKLSNIDVNILAKLFDAIELTIEEKVYEDRIKDIFNTEIDLEFALLSISNENGKEKIKFIPKEDLINKLKNAEQRKHTTLRKRLEKNITNKLLETFKIID